MSFMVKFKNLLFETFRENKKLIIGLYILFIVCFILAWILSASKLQANLGSIGPVNSTGVGSTVGASELFINNEWGGIVTYVTSVLFAIPAFVMLVYNAVNLGATGQLFNLILPNGGLEYIIYIIPHGIFEITATVLQSVAGVLLFMFIFKFVKSMLSSETQGVSEAFDKTKKLLIQSLVLMIFSTVLLIIAALIEAYFSVPFSDFIMGLLN